MRRTTIPAAVLAAICLGPAGLHAQYPSPPTGLPTFVPPQAPVLPSPLHVRLAGPPGMRVTAHRGAVPQSFAAPSQFAFRPGRANLRAS